MVSSKVGHDKLPKFLEPKVRWKTRITRSRRAEWMWSPTDKKGKFIQALQYDKHALQMPQWSENLQSVLEAWGFSIHKVAQPAEALWELSLAVPFLPLGPTGNTCAELLFINTHVTVWTDLLLPFLSELGLELLNDARLLSCLVFCFYPV